MMNFGVVAAASVVVWLISLRLRDVSIVDIFWGFGFVMVGASTAAQSDGWTGWDSVILGMVIIWGLRLTGYLAWRNWGEGEDYRYASLRERFGSAFPLLSLVIVFLLQAALIWVVSLPVQTALVHFSERRGMPALGIAGVLVWVTGLLFESVGDYQLARFRANSENSGEVLNTGLWRYTRHPNYFGDFLAWWGLSLTACGAGAAWWSLIGPIVMSILLMRVSGVTLLESSLRTRKPGYAEYAARTNTFFPWRPKAR